MAEAVREVTDNGILFVDNNYYSNMGIPCCNTPITVNGKREEKQCFGPHAYDLMVDTPAYKYANNSRVGMIFDEHRNTQVRLNVPCLVGEWGSCAEGDGWYPHIRFLQDKFDSYKWSNTYWCYFDNILQEDFIKLLTRPYPKAVTGFINEYKYDYVNGTFTLKYTQDKEFKVPNVVYIPSDAKKILVDGVEARDAKIVKHNGNIGSDVIFDTKTGEHTVEIQL
jgi:endoglycosylceramidase